MINPLSSSAVAANLSGMGAASRALTKTSQNIAAGPQSAQDLTRDLITGLAAENDFAANAAALRRNLENEKTLGRILDEKA